MLEVTLRVTTSPTHLVQIHQIGIVNTTLVDTSGFTTYDVWLDGEKKDSVVHHRENGALELTRIVLESLDQKGEL